MKKQYVASAMMLALGAASVQAQDLFQAPVQMFTDLQTTGIAVGDINGDGLKDVVATSCGCGLSPNSNVYVYLQTASHAISTTPVIYTIQNGADSVTIGDVTGDGRNDLVIRAGFGFTVVPQNADGTLAPGIVYPSGFADGARTGDLNGDGRLDAIGLETGPDGHLNTEEAGVLYQNASGSFDPQVLVPLPHGFGDDIDVTDINGDGRVDVIVANGFNEPPITILYQTAAGTLSAPVQLAIAPGVLASHVAVGDVDGDGRKDLVIGYAPYDPVAHLAVFHQNADGSFAAPVLSDVASELTSLEVGDANHDGRTDILLLHRVSLGIVLQNAAGGLDAESLVALPDNAGGHSKLGFTAADINGDGAVDVAYTQVGSQGAVTVLSGTPPVTNRPPVAVSDTVTVRCNDGIAIPVLANDSDPDGDTITVVSVTAPRHGTTKILPNGKVLYDPVKRYRGADRFLYVISDGHGHFAQTGVNVTVN